MRITSMIDECTFQSGFEEDDQLRSTFIRGLMLEHVPSDYLETTCQTTELETIPKTLVRYWHNADDLPDDVRACLISWDRLRTEGLELHTFDDATAGRYIAARFGARERAAFARCRHPAMRSDYFRMCYVLAEGGAYVDADDVLVKGERWRELFRGRNLKLQPLCYDIASHGMLTIDEIWRRDLRTDGRIFYVNNNPLAAPAGHPVLRRGLARATERLLGAEPTPEIQSTTGPGNLTASLAAHAREQRLAGAVADYELLHDWGAIAMTQWDLSYRNDARNWRNMDSE